jgi:hypothetical protein
MRSTTAFKASGGGTTFVHVRCTSSHFILVYCTGSLNQIRPMLHVFIRMRGIQFSPLIVVTDLACVEATLIIFNVVVPAFLYVVSIPWFLIGPGLVFVVERASFGLTFILL